MYRRQEGFSPFNFGERQKLHTLIIIQVIVFYGIKFRATVVYQNTYIS